MPTYEVETIDDKPNQIIYFIIILGDSSCLSFLSIKWRKEALADSPITALGSDESNFACGSGLPIIH